MLQKRKEFYFNNGVVWDKRILHKINEQIYEYLSFNDFKA